MVTSSTPRVLFVSSEVHPFARTGGLAFVAGSLPTALSRIGYEVAISLPLYRKVFPAGYHLETLMDVEVPIGKRVKRGFLHQSRLGEQIPVFLVSQDEYFDRENLYGDKNGDYPDNVERFVFFCRALLSAVPATGWKPDIIHCNDWQTALIPLYLRALRSEYDFSQDTKTLLTIHNLAYQGLCPREELSTMGLGEEYFAKDKLEFYGKVNTMKAGLIYADALSTVSPTYCKEIQTAEYGCGLDGLLRERRGDLHGILNGIDYQVWDPSDDEGPTAPYSVQNLRGKKENKKALQIQSDLPVTDVPLVSVLSRLDDQKGLDLVGEVIEEMMTWQMQFILLGQGDKRYVEMFEDIGRRFPTKTSIHPYFDLSMAKRVYAGSDIFLMPSRYEPCGLGQMIAMRYGTIPVVRKTGGLTDTVKEFNPSRGQGNGFFFRKYCSLEMINALKKAMRVYESKDVWEQLIRNAMREDFSWATSVVHYDRVYKALLKRRLSRPARTSPCGGRAASNA